tara:strand:+ start:3372 stop:3566 length:195 start_codon:yes stop_codon:yes gene_type:complete
MQFKDACWRMPKEDRMALWMKRIESVDTVLETANTGWQLNYWGSVRRQLVYQLSLLSNDKVYEK